MGTLYIRNLPDALVKAVRMKAIEEDKRIDELLAPFIELAVNSKPINSPIVSDGSYGTQKRNAPVGKKP